MSKQHKTNGEGTPQAVAALVSEHLKQAALKPNWELIVMPKPERDWLMVYHAGDKLKEPRDVVWRRNSPGVCEAFESFKKSLGLKESPETLSPEMRVTFKFGPKDSLVARAIENPDGSLTLKPTS